MRRVGGTMDRMATPGSFAPHSSASFVFARAARPAWPQRSSGPSGCRGSWSWIVTMVTIKCPVRFNIVTHFLREVQDLGKDFPEAHQVAQFVTRFAPLLAHASKFRAR